MKKIAKIILNTTLFASLGLSSIVVQAGSWDNFKIRYFHLTQYLNNQDRELQDIQAQNLDPQKYSRINLAELLNGGPQKMVFLLLIIQNLIQLQQHLFLLMKQ